VSRSPLFFQASQILYLKQNLEQALALKINKMMTFNANSLQEQSGCENNLTSIAL